MDGNKNGFVAGCQKVNVDLVYEGLPRIPGEGHEVYARDFSVQMGGGYPGTLCNLSRLGVPVCLMTMLGTDMFSAFAEDYFRKNHMEVLNLTPGTDRIPVNISSVLLTPGDRTFVSYGGQQAWTEEMSRKVREHTEGARICLLDAEHPELYRPLKEQGTILVLDTGWSDDMFLESWEELLTLADYYTPNQKEAMKLTGTDTPEKAAEVLSKYFDRVVVKLDAAGCLLMEEGRMQVVPAIPDTVFRDATGAGDAFLAGFLYGLYHGYSFAETVLCGNIMGARCVSGIGCLTNGYSEPEFLAIFDRYREMTY